MWPVVSPGIPALRMRAMSGSRAASRAGHVPVVSGCTLPGSKAQAEIESPRTTNPRVDGCVTAPCEVCRSGDDGVDRVVHQDLRAGLADAVDVLEPNSTKSRHGQHRVTDRNGHPLRQGQVLVGRDDRRGGWLLEAQANAVADAIHLVVAEPV